MGWMVGSRRSCDVSNIQDAQDTQTCCAARLESAETDRRLLQRVGAGERDALTDLYLRYRQPLFNYLSRLTPDYALAEDLLQETFVAIWRSASQFEGVPPSAPGCLALPAVRRITLCDGAIFRWPILRNSKRRRRPILSRRMRSWPARRARTCWRPSAGFR